MSTFFGEPWPSGVCDGGVQVPRPPIDQRCWDCGVPIVEGDRGTFVMAPSKSAGLAGGPSLARFAPIHRECSLRNVLGGIGHLTDHAYWCGKRHDPDGGRSRRGSALEVWAWVQNHGVEAAADA